MIESDPNNPETIYAGGIDLFKSTTGAENATANPWEQFTHWYNGFGQQFAHADQHNMAFGNYDSSKKILEAIFNSSPEVQRNPGYFNKI